MEVRNGSRLFFALTLFLIWSVNYTVSAQEDGFDNLSNFRFAIMAPDQSRSFTAESNGMFDLMFIHVIVLGQGTLRISVSKTDTIGEVIAVMQKGEGYPDSGCNVGITPRTLTLSSRFWWDYGTTVVASGLFSMEEGPHKYTVRLSY